MTAHVSVNPLTAPESRVLCPDCDLDRTYPRTAPAQAAARDHNRLRHAYPEHTLEIGDPDA